MYVLLKQEVWLVQHVSCLFAAASQNLKPVSFFELSISKIDSTFTFNGFLKMAI